MIIVTNRTPEPQVTFAEWLSGGVVIHFDNGECSWFAADFLFANRETPPNYLFGNDSTGGEHE